MLEQDCHKVVAVIEDDDVSRCALGRLLRAGGFETALFESAEAFMAAAARAWFCLIVDVQLDGLSGLDLQRHLHLAGSDVPMIITTGNRAESIRRRAEEEGCVAFLWKPVNPDIVLTLLSSLPPRLSA